MECHFNQLPIIVPCFSFPRNVTLLRLFAIMKWKGCGYQQNVIKSGVLIRASACKGLTRLL